jgi:hypothetical protein
VAHQGVRPTGCGTQGVVHQAQDPLASVLDVEAGGGDEGGGSRESLDAAGCTSVRGRRRMMSSSRPVMAGSSGIGRAGASSNDSRSSTTTIESSAPPMAPSTGQGRTALGSGIGLQQQQSWQRQQQRQSKHSSAQKKDPDGLRQVQEDAHSSALSMTLKRSSSGGGSSSGCGSSEGGGDSSENVSRPDMYIDMGAVQGVLTIDPPSQCTTRPLYGSSNGGGSKRPSTTLLPGCSGSSSNAASSSSSKARTEHAQRGQQHRTEERWGWG